MAKKSLQIAGHSFYKMLWLISIDIIVQINVHFLNGLSF